MSFQFYKTKRYYHFTCITPKVRITANYAVKIKGANNPILIETSIQSYQSWNDVESLINFYSKDKIDLVKVSFKKKIKALKSLTKAKP